MLHVSHGLSRGKLQTLSSEKHLLLLLLLLLLLFGDDKRLPGYQAVRYKGKIIRVTPYRVLVLFAQRLHFVLYIQSEHEERTRLRESVP